MRAPTKVTATSMSETSEVSGDRLYSRFRTVALGDPTATALWVDGEAYSYREVLERVEGCADALSAQGVRPADAVAIVLSNGLDFVVGVLGTFALGGMVVPLNPRFTSDEMRQYLGATCPRVALHLPELAGLLREEGVPVRATSDRELLDLPASSAPNGPALPVEGSDLARLAGGGVYMFSSGSTGRAKRVTRSDRQVLAEYLALQRTVRLEPSDRILCTVPLFHAHGFCNALLAALLSGGQLLLLTGEFHARTVLRTLEQLGATVYATVPFMIRMLVESRQTSRHGFPNLRLVISAGAPLSGPLAASALGLFGLPVSQLYGSTETGALTINNERAREKPGSVGRPLRGFELEIRAPDGSTTRSRLLGPGQEGEVWVRTPSMAGCYDGLVELTEECFVGSWFATGDLGYLDEEGDLYLTGRKKLLINVAGFKVDPLEVEEVLGAHPDVKEAVVLGIEDEMYGEQVKAVIAPRGDGELDEAELIAYARRHLAEFKVPKAVVFCREIPRSPLGKILRKYL